MSAIISPCGRDIRDLRRENAVSEEIATILERAADRLSKPGAWTQGAPARNDAGRIVPYDDIDACSFCVIGAVWRMSDQSGRRFSADRAFREFLGTSRVGIWNDAKGRTQEEVVAKLREAAAKARADQ